MIGLRASSRVNVQVTIDFPQAAGRRFAATIESVGGNPVDLVVERAMYSNSGGVVWSAGTNAVATKIQWRPRPDCIATTFNYSASP